VDVPSSVTVRIQRGKTAKPFTVHVDKVKPYVSDYMPKSWVMDESAVSESERPAVEQSNEFESSTERLESPTKQGPTEQRSQETEISAEFVISSDTELKTPLRDTQRKARVESGYEVDCPQDRNELVDHPHISKTMHVCIPSDVVGLVIRSSLCKRSVS